MNRIDHTPVEIGGRVVVSIHDLPLYLRIARRGRPHQEAATEAGVAVTTLRSAEDGIGVSVATLRRLAGWIDCAILIDSRSSSSELDELEEDGEEEPDAERLPFRQTSSEAPDG